MLSVVILSVVMLNVMAPQEWMSFFAKSRCPTEKKLFDYFEWRKMSLCWVSLYLVSLYWMLFMRASLFWVSLCWMLWCPWNECHFLPNQGVLPKKQKKLFYYFKWRKMSLCWVSLCLVSLYWVLLLCERRYSECRYAERRGAPGMNVVFCQIKVSYWKYNFLIILNEERCLYAECHCA